MEPNIIVMITLLLMPNGDNGIHVKPFETVAACTEAADIEASDPFVAHVECSELSDGNLTLQFKRNGETPDRQITRTRTRQGAKLSGADERRFFAAHSDEDDRLILRMATS